MNFVPFKAQNKRKVSYDETRFVKLYNQGGLSTLRLPKKYIDGYTRAKLFINKENSLIKVVRSNEEGLFINKKGHIFFGSIVNHFGIPKSVTLLSYYFDEPENGNIVIEIPVN